MRNTIVIVGGGFCGTVLAANLLRRPPAAATDIVLIERSSAMGRGVAYADREFPYLLNVPAARLSADSRDPLQFLRFAQLRHAPATEQTAANERTGLSLTPAVPVPSASGSTRRGCCTWRCR